MFNTQIKSELHCHERHEEAFKKHDVALWNSWKHLFLWRFQKLSMVTLLRYFSTLKLGPELQTWRNSVADGRLGSSIFYSPSPQWGPWVSVYQRYQLRDHMVLPLLDLTKDCKESCPLTHFSTANRICEPCYLALPFQSVWPVQSYELRTARNRLVLIHGVRLILDDTTS